LFADGDEGGNIFRKTGAAVADSGIEKIAADAAVHPDSVGDSFDVGAAGLTDRRERIDVGDFQREK